MSMSNSELESLLTATFADERLSGDEKQHLKTLADTLEDEQLRFLSNRSFDIFRQVMNDTKHAHELDDVRRAFKWLERTQKALIGNSAQLAPSCYFSPGDDCRRAILDACHSARRSLDICVFTISDNRLSETIIACHKRGITVRIISDDDKSHDDGSDIHYLSTQGIAVKTDNSPNHMHHKFAIIDKRQLLNGSFNWTRSASERNQENIMISHHPKAIAEYQARFEQLWSQF